MTEFEIMPQVENLRDFRRVTVTAYSPAATNDELVIEAEGKTFCSLQFSVDEQGVLRLCVLVPDGVEWDALGHDLRGINLGKED